MKIKNHFRGERLMAFRPIFLSKFCLLTKPSKCGKIHYRIALSRTANFITRFYGDMKMSIIATEIYNDLCKMYVEDLYCFLALFDMNSNYAFSESEFNHLMNLHDLAYQELQGTL